MTRLCKHILCLAVLAVPVSASADDLPVLPVASEIVRGELPDGVEYYLVRNEVPRGLADIALVQRDGSGTGCPGTVLSALSFTTGTSAWKLMARNGVGCGPGGYATGRNGFTVYDFRDVPVSEPSVLDSALLAVTSMTSMSEYRQAVVISGDIDVAKVSERLRLFSMLVPARRPYEPREPYVWKSYPVAEVTSSPAGCSRLASVTASYSMPGIPADRMQTPLPIVTGTLAENFSIMLRRRLTLAFKAADIPYGAIECRYSGSGETGRDENFSVSVHTAPEDIDRATRCLASVLAGFDGRGIEAGELCAARPGFRMNLRSRADDGGNALYVEECVANYVNGAGLVSKKTVTGYIEGIRVDDEKAAGLVESFVSSFLDPQANLTLSFRMPDGCGGCSPESFTQGWNEPFGGGDVDCSRFPVLPDCGQVKLRSETKDKVSGGILWMFSNGMRVVFKNMPMPGKTLDYALMIRGGTTSVEGLRRGEGAFFSDMLKLCSIDGMPFTEMDESLRSRDVRLSVGTGTSDLRFRGTVPKNGLDTLLRVLASFERIEAPDGGDLDWYRRCETLRETLSRESVTGVNAFMDSLIRPGSVHGCPKSVCNLYDDTPSKAAEYVRSQMRRADDGILVITGDISSDELRKILCGVLGAFHTSKLIVPSPENVEPALASGTLTIIESADNCVYGRGLAGTDFEICCKLPFAKSDFFAARIAEILISRRVSGMMAGIGFWSRTSSKFRTYPDETFSLFLNTAPCKTEGLPGDVVRCSPYEALNVMRNFLSGLGDIEFSSAEIETAKAVLASRTGVEMAESSNLVDAVLLRYSVGKDIVTDSKAQISAVTPDMIKGVLKSLAGGCRVEYVRV